MALRALVDKVVVVVVNISNALVTPLVLRLRVVGTALSSSVS